MKELTHIAVDRATSLGASYADIRIIETKSEDMTVRNGEIAELVLEIGHKRDDAVVVDPLKMPHPVPESIIRVAGMIEGIRRPHGGEERPAVYRKHMAIAAVKPVTDLW